MVYEFHLAGQRVRLWQKTGETYQHILLKALGFAMYAPLFPTLEIETRVGLRYRPDLVARDAQGRFLFWGECGLNSLRKTAWLLKHAGVEQLVLFKLEQGNLALLIEQLRAAVAPRYRPAERLQLINFAAQVGDWTTRRIIETVPPAWFTRHII